MVLSGKILAFLPDHVAARWVDSGTMRRVGGDQLSYKIEMELITRDTKDHSVAVASFLEDYASVSIQRAIHPPYLS